MDDRHTEILRDIQAHGRQLDGHIGVQTTFMDAIEQMEILSAGRPRFGLRMHTLAEQSSDALMPFG